MSQKYLVVRCYCYDDFYDPRPEFVIVPIDKNYIWKLIDLDEKASSIKGCHQLQCHDERARFIAYPLDEEMTDVQASLFELDLENLDFVVTSLDLGDFAKRSDVYMDTTLAIFYASTGLSEVSFGGYLADTQIWVDTPLVPLMTILGKLDD